MIRELKLSEMMDVQDVLNEFTIENWKRTIYKNQFKVALFDELAEFLGSGRSWKWWKHENNPNVFNEKIEIIDCLHFYLSMILLTNNGSCDYNFNIGYRNSGDIRAPMFDYDGTINHNCYMRHVNQLLNEKISAYYIDDFVKSVGLTSEEISAIYTAKAELNAIRQSTGYKDGTYKKIVDGVEDNQRMEHIIDAFLFDNSMTLDDIKKSVKEEFFVG